MLGDIKTVRKMSEKIENKQKKKCGIIMPISAIENYAEDHWIDVREIIFDAIEDADLLPNMVSDADDVGIIQKRIIQNIYENPIVVCDVSGKNPNVMFELGMRLAFDKPTIIIKDNITTYSFDTAPIEHLTYPRDLRFNKIIEFKEQLISKIKGTLKQAETNPEFTPFLKHFGNFKIAKLETKEVQSTEYILDSLQEIRDSISDLKSNNKSNIKFSSRRIALCLQHASQKEAEKILSLLEPVGEFNLVKKGSTHFHFESPNYSSLDWDEILRIGQTIVPGARIFPVRK